MVCSYVKVTPGFAAGSISRWDRFCPVIHLRHCPHSNGVCPICKCKPECTGYTSSAAESARVFATHSTLYFRLSRLRGRRRGSKGARAHHLPSRSSQKGSTEKPQGYHFSLSCVAPSLQDYARTHSQQPKHLTHNM